MAGTRDQPPAAARDPGSRERAGQRRPAPHRRHRPRTEVGRDRGGPRAGITTRTCHPRGLNQRPAAPPGKGGSTMSAEDKVKNTAETAKGKAKEGVGTATGNESLKAEGRGGGRHGYCRDVSECSHRVSPVLRLIGVSGPALESPGRGGGESVRGAGGVGMAAVGWVVAGAVACRCRGRLRSWRGRPRLWPGLACGGTLTLASGWPLLGSALSAAAASGRRAR